MPSTAKLRAALAALLGGTGSELAGVLAGAPSVSVARHVWRALDAVWREATRAAASALEVTVFALPLSIVVGNEGASEGGSLSGVVEDADRLAAVLRDHGALSGNTTFALSNALVAAEAIDIARLPAMLAWCRLPEAHVAGAALPPRALPPAPMEFAPARIRAPAVHYRCRDCANRGGPHGGRRHGKVGHSVRARARRADCDGQASRCSRCRALRGACCRRSRKAASRNGTWRRRSSRATPFASSAARSASRAPSSARIARPTRRGAGSSGFRCPRRSTRRQPKASAARSIRSIARTTSSPCSSELLRDCRVTDIRTLAGVHADRADGASAPLMFKPESIARRGEVPGPLRSRASPRLSLLHAADAADLLRDFRIAEIFDRPAPERSMSSAFSTRTTTRPAPLTVTLGRFAGELRRAIVARAGNLDRLRDGPSGDLHLDGARTVDCELLRVQADDRELVAPDADTASRSVSRRSARTLAAPSTLIASSVRKFNVARIGRGSPRRGRATRGGPCADERELAVLHSDSILRKLLWRASMAMDSAPPWTSITSAKPLMAIWWNGGSARSRAPCRRPGVSRPKCQTRPTAAALRHDRSTGRAWVHEGRR